MWFNFSSTEEFVSYDASQIKLSKKRKASGGKKRERERERERIGRVEEKEKEEKKRKGRWSHGHPAVRIWTSHKTQRSRPGRCPCPLVQDDRKEQSLAN